jgi:hypothetical protein
VPTHQYLMWDIGWRMERAQHPVGLYPGAVPTSPGALARTESISMLSRPNWLPK